MLVIRSKKPTDIVKYVDANEPASVTGTPGDTWKKYLGNNGGTGDTFHDMEHGYLRAQSATSWDKFVQNLGHIVGTLRENLRKWLSTIIAPSSSYYLQEDGTSKYVLEDGSGSYILE